MSRSPGSHQRPRAVDGVIILVASILAALLAILTGSARQTASLALITGGGILLLIGFLPRLTAAGWGLPLQILGTGLGVFGTVLAATDVPGDEITRLKAALLLGGTAAAWAIAAMMLVKAIAERVKNR